jgi:hypothetical protein
MSWSSLNDRVEDRGSRPSPLLSEAFVHCKNGAEALSLGAVATKDIDFLAKKGLRVTVINPTKTPGHADQFPRNIVTVHSSPFEEYNFPSDIFDFVTAQYSLPFTKPASFPMVIEKMGDSLVDGGIFVGQLFGDKDGWSQNKKMTFLTLEQSRAFFTNKNWDILKFHEELNDGPTAGQGSDKFWHVFHIIAQRIR